MNVSGCPNSCAQHQVAGSGLSGMTRRVGEAEAPGYRILLGGGGDATGAELGRYVARTLARRVPQTVVAVVQRYVDERIDEETFRAWVHRTGPEELEAWLAAQDPARDGTPAGDVEPELLTDWGSDGTFQVSLGRSECA